MNAAGFALFLAVALLPWPALAEEITAVVVRVKDGDTLRVRFDCPRCPKILQALDVRLRGIDAPELKDKRPDRAFLAGQAKVVLNDLCPPGTPVILSREKWDKYGGRLVARLHCNGVDAAETLKGLGLALDYNGKGRKPW